MMKNLFLVALISFLSVGAALDANAQSLQDKIQCPAKIESVTQLNKCGAQVKYIDPFQKIADEELVSLQCNSESGAYFETGENTVYYKATDMENNSYFCIFKVKISDNQKPFFTSFPKDLSVNARAKDGAYVTWEKPMADDNCGEIHIISSHEPGDFFPIGKTLVTYWVHDAEGNYVTERFTVLVSEDPLSLNAEK